MKPIKLILAALAGLSVLAGCQKTEEDFVDTPQNPAEKPADAYTITLQASKGAETKALSLDTSGATDRLNAHWRSGETVAVYLGGTLLGTLTATADGTDATKATLSGYLTTVEGVQQGSELMLLFPRAEWDYTGQDGSAPDETGPLATRYDYATATVTVATVDNVNKVISTTSGANFENQQSIYRFMFKMLGNSETVPVKSFRLKTSRQMLVRSRVWSAGSWTDNFGSIDVTVPSGTLTMPYVSIRNTFASPSSGTQTDLYQFSVIGADDALYLGSHIIPNFMEQGKFISAKNVIVEKAKVVESSDQTNTAW